MFCKMIGDRQKYLLFYRRHFQRHFNKTKYFAFYSNVSEVDINSTIDDMSQFVQIMCWCPAGDKPLSESVVA